MKATVILASLVLGMVVGTAGLAAPQAGATGFTYVGQLSAPDGLYDLRFTLYDSPTGSNPRGNPIEVGGVTVADGCFTVNLDFGCDLSSGSGLWLDIDDRSGDSDEAGPYTSLGPRRRISSLTQGPQSGRVFIDGDTALGSADGLANGVTGDRHLSMASADIHSTADATNTFLGWEAGMPGSRNTCIGYSAACSRGEGSGNIFIGANAGGFYQFMSVYSDAASDARNALNALNSNNTVVGTEAGYWLTTGYNNTFLGYQAGFSNKEGSDNVFCGYQAGYSNTTIKPPSLPGTVPLPSNSGYRNTFSGYQAGYSNTTGDNNTFFGHRAGYSNKTGNLNTFLGVDAGYMNTGTGNIFIGHAAGYSETGSSKLYIANTGTTTPLIYGDFSAGRVGLGMTSPTERLDINGTARLRGIAAGFGTGVLVDATGKLLKASSSQRYKTDIEALPEEGDKVLGLRPVRFRWQSTGQADIGLIAEEVADVLDSLVIRDAEGQPEAVKYDRVPLYLLSVIQAQQQRITAGETENQFLTQRIEALEIAETQNGSLAEQIRAAEVENRSLTGRIEALERALRQMQHPGQEVRQP